MVSLTKKILKIVDAGSSALALASIIAIFALMLSVSVDVSMREGIGKTVPGLFEGTELLLVIAIFFGLAVEQKNSGHIKVTVLTDRMPKKVRLFLQRIALIISAAIVLWITIQTGFRAIESFSTAEVRWGTVQFPVWPVRASISVGYSWYFLQICVSFLRTFSVFKLEETTIRDDENTYGQQAVGV